MSWKNSVLICQKILFRNANKNSRLVHMEINTGEKFWEPQLITLKNRYEKCVIRLNHDDLVNVEDHK